MESPDIIQQPQNLEEDNIFNLKESKEENRMNKFSLKFLNPLIEKEYIKMKEFGTGQRRIICILILIVLVLICARIIVRMIVRIKENNFLLTPIFIAVLIMESFSIVMETILFFVQNKIKILRGMIGTTLGFFGLIFLSYHISKNTVGEPYFAPTTPVLIIVIFCIFLVYMRNWICCLICIIIDLGICLWYMNSIVYLLWLETVLHNIIYLLGFILLALSINYMEKFQRNSVYNKFIIESERTNLKNVIEHFPISVIICNEGKVNYKNQSFKDLCQIKLQTDSSSDLNANEISCNQLVPSSGDPNLALNYIIKENGTLNLYEIIKNKQEISHPEIFKFCNSQYLNFLLEITSFKIQIRMKESHIYLIKDQTLISKVISRERQESLTLFLKSVSHDFRSPLSGIIGCSENSLADSNIHSNSILEKNLKSILCSAKLMLILVQDILDYSTSQGSEIKISSINFNFKKSFEEITYLIEIGYKKPGVTFIKHVDSNLPEEIKSDENRIQQIIMNLLSNAFKFTKPGGTVAINAYYNNLDDKISIEVIDSGVGISEENLKKLFQPFVKLNDPEGLNPKGIGLGLSNCKNYARLLGGEINVESEVNKGSKFRVSLACNTGSNNIQQRCEKINSDSSLSYEFRYSEIRENRNPIKFEDLKIVF